MKKILVVMSHALSDTQKEALADFTIAEPTQAIAMAAKNVDPKASTQEIRNLAANIVRLALEKNCTHLLCMGEPSLFFATVTLAKLNGITCCVATTERISQEITLPDGSVKKTNVFSHVQFRDL